jgi:proteasome accessory factor A
MSELAPRITGTEMEWSVMVQPQAGWDFKPLVNEFGGPAGVIKSCPPRISHLGDYLANGARYYHDVGHVEYATPESRSIIGTVAEEIAGEQIVYESLARFVAGRELHDARLNKRVIDDERHVWGYHMNLSSQTPALLFAKNYLPVLGLHLATLNAYGGAGAVVPNGRGQLRFAVAQKTATLTTDSYYSSHSVHRPLISLRSEPHADKNRMSRVHISSMDANMSPWATWMKLGTISLVLRLVEDGYDANNMLTQRPLYEMAKRVGFDQHFKANFELTDGRTISTLGIQEELFEQAYKFAETHDIPQQERDILPEWERALEDLREDPLLLANRADWVAKKVILEEYMDRHELRLSSPEIAKKDRQFDLISPLGFGMKLRQKRWLEWMPAAERIQRALTKPPRNTRAKIRGDFILACANMKRQTKSEVANFNTSWTNVAVNSNSIYLGDPYQSHSSRVDYLVAGIARSKRRAGRHR